MRFSHDNLVHLYNELSGNHMNLTGEYSLDKKAVSLPMHCMKVGMGRKLFIMVSELTWKLFLPYLIFFQSILIPLLIAKEYCLVMYCFVNDKFKFQYEFEDVTVYLKIKSDIILELLRMKLPKEILHII